MNNELIEMYDQKVSELIETIKKEMSGHKLTIEPDSDLLCQEEDCSFSILISLQIQQYQTDDGTVTPLPAEVTFDYRAEEDEWVMLVGQDGDEDLAVTRAGLFEVLFYYCSQAALTQQQGDTHGFKNFHKSLCERFGYGADEIDWRRDQVSLIEHIAALSQQQEAEPVGVVPQDVEEFIASESCYDPEHPKSSEHDYILVDDLRTWMAGHVRVPVEPNDAMQAAGASAIRIETTALNKLWTANAVFRAMLNASKGE